MIKNQLHDRKVSISVHLQFSITSEGTTCENDMQKLPIMQFGNTYIYSKRTSIVKSNLNDWSR